MSKGPGRIERAIVAIFEREPDAALTVEELCEIIFATDTVEKKHRVSVIRAGKKLMTRGALNKGLECYRSESVGGQLVFFNRYDVMSYALARLKADSRAYYRSNDSRRWPGS